MSEVGHVMILASAGSGKTYALTNRFVRLLAHGAKPERIAALTFTRKAAGEFFDEILKKLAQAAESESAARKLAEEIERPGLGPVDFLRLLREMVAAMHRLNLGTFDSFFARIVRAFPLELGLGGDFEVLQSHAVQVERRRVLRRMFAHTEGGVARQDFIEAFKRATFGTEEKRLGARLDTFLDEHAETFLTAPDGEAWGRATRIWPEGNDWLAAADSRRRGAAATTLRAALPWESLNDKQRQRMENFFVTLPEWAAGAPLPKPVAYLVENAFKAWPALGEITLERKKVTLNAEASRALRDVVKGIVGAELTRRLEVTQGMFAVLQGYEQVYDHAVRRAGRLTFSDVQRLLRPDSPDGARLLTREAAAEARLFIDWRLDAQIDHWLLDEFQDTSFGQWSVLRNLIDEAVQDPTEARSFFYVGDVKQAIFAWREGDSRLFREIFNHYNAARPGSIREEHLDKSYRSSPDVIAMVNRVFGDKAALRELFPEEAARRWNDEWRDHESARKELRGYAALRHADDEAGRFAETLRILQETRVLERGLSSAVLVQKNSTAAELADFLRREGGVPAMAESDLRVGADNPLTCALLALFRAVAHPGDTAAWTHVKMTPLQAVLVAENCETDEAVVRRLLEEIHARGFERTVESWVRKLMPALAATDEFSRERGRQLVEAARMFDVTGGREVAEFVQFVENYTVRDADLAAVVRVMTVHKAKGLGFDLVILPDLQGTKLASRRRGLAVKRARDRAVEWVYDLPPEIFYAEDPVLRSHVATMEAEACYEQLALLYVAMTRAKRAMYVITEPVGTSRSLNFPRLLQETLGEEWKQGDARWYEAVSTEAEAPAANRGLLPLALTRVPRRSAATPSRAKGAEVNAARLFALEGGHAADLGKAMHDLLARVEWVTPQGLQDLGRAWHAEGEAGWEALAVLQSPQLKAVWTQPAESAIVWRERAFEIVLNGTWVTGIFDRVVVPCDATGRPKRAVVYDFKTDRGVSGQEAEAALRHASQLAHYRRVVAVLTGLPLPSVAAEVIFTESGRSVSL